MLNRAVEVMRLSENSGKAVSPTEGLAPDWEGGEPETAPRTQLCCQAWHLLGEKEGKDRSEGDRGAPTGAESVKERG